MCDLPLKNSMDVDHAIGPAPASAGAASDGATGPASSATVAAMQS